MGHCEVAACRQATTVYGHRGRSYSQYTSRLPALQSADRSAPVASTKAQNLVRAAFTLRGSQHVGQTKAARAAGSRVHTAHCCESVAHTGASV